MKSNELRTGNWVKYNGIKRVVNGIYIESPEIGYLIQLDELLPMLLEENKHIDPIPLTEERLIRFGFEFITSKPGTNGIYSNGKARVALSYNGNVYTLRNKPLQYVHTLQNWYYYDQLTGEELKELEDEK